MFEFAPRIETGAGDLPTPTSLGQRIKASLAGLGEGWVEGEVRGVHLATSGHCYFDLVDEESSLSCAIWRGRLQRMADGDRPRDGATVRVHYDRISFLPYRSSVSLAVDDVVPTGEGELIRRAQEALAILVAEGLTDADRKRPLRVIPRRIGLIAGKDSDAMADVIRHVHDRWPGARIVTHAALVQGVECVGSVIDAIAALQDVPGVDVIIIARGGGSVDDLMPFSDVRMCRAIAACAVPVVTSIGHTKQVPNCDHVADATANVPARVAELVVPDVRLHRLLLDDAADVLAGGSARLAARAAALALQARHLQPGRRLDAARLSHERSAALLARRHEGWLALEMGRLRAHGAQLTAATVRARDGGQGLARLAGGLQAHRQRARERLSGRAQLLGGMAAERERAGRRALPGARRNVASLLGLINAHDHRRRGFAVLRDAAGHAIASIQGLAPGSAVDVELADGRARARIESIYPEEDE